MHRFAITIVLLCVCAGPHTLCATVSTGAVWRASGGGYLDAGLYGEYFPNATFSGAPAFARRDVRLDFDWGTLLPVGGSVADAYRTFPRDNFSIRWSGRIMARFSETYTFKAQGDDLLTLAVKPTNSATWTTLINISSANPDGVTATNDFIAGMPYDIRVTYVDLTGAALAVLRWSSPSTPEEVIDPVTFHGINAASWGANYCLADLTKRARWWASPNGTDANGWSLGDCQMVLADGVDNCQGTYLMQFEGKASVVSMWSGASLLSGTNWVTTLPSGVGYDPVSNVTRTLMKTSNVNGNWGFIFNATQRDNASLTNTGITNIRFMRPLEPGTNVPHQLGAVTYEPIRQAFQQYTAIRWLAVANSSPAYGDWPRRTRPSHMQFNTSITSTNCGECWEYLIMMANECGKDLYLTTPMQADDEYFLKLAQVLRYGSDGTEPYTADQADPVYPPLNPNLCVYLEVGNEIWNWAFGSTQYAQSRGGYEVINNTPDGQIMNYDGKCGTSGITCTRRFHAVRSVRASDAFRGVFGDDAMGARIRVCLEQQYNNAQNETYASYRFMENYYNNADGIHVATPHPVRYFFWGGGGATYYGTGNSNGDQTNIAFVDKEFVVPTVPDGSATPGTPGGSWQFTGNAGIYRNASIGVDLGSNGTARAASVQTGVGMKFRTGSVPLYLHELGRWYNSSYSGVHTVQLVRVSDKMLLASVRTAANTMNSGFGLNWLNHFRYGRILSGGLPAPITLETNTEYYLLSEERSGNDNYYKENTRVVPVSDISVLGAVSAAYSNQPINPAAWAITETAGANLCYGPVNFRCSTNAAMQYTRFPNPPYDAQAAFIIGTGSFSGTLNFPTTGVFSLTFMAACGTAALSFDAYVDNALVSPRSQSDYRISASGFGMGGFARVTTIFEEYWGSSVFTITNPGVHSVRFAGRTVSTNYVVIDNVMIAGVEEIINSGFGSGQAQGQVAQANYFNQLNNQAKYSRVFGLETIAYEAGLSIGGDFRKRPIQLYCYFGEPRIRIMNNEAMDIFTGSGGHLNVWGVYAYWPAYDIAGASSYPLMQSLNELSGRLRAEGTNGLPVPAVLNTNTIVKWLYSNADSRLALTNLGTWASWLIVCPKTSRYVVQVNASTGGTLVCEADGIIIGSGASVPVSSPFFKTVLVKGLHGIRVRNMSGGFTISNVLVFEDTSVAPPDFAPPPGAYPGTLNVTMSTATVGATIRYTTDGSTPATNSGTIYTAPVPIPGNLTLAAIAYKDGSPNSEVVSGRYFISTLAITTAMLPYATSHVAYVSAVTASGGTPPYLWTNIAGTLPAGLNLASDGGIAGTPVSAGSNTFTVRVTDDLGANVARQLALIVVPEPAWTGALAATGALLAAAARQRARRRENHV